jgi:hypothetical protein
VEWNSDNQNRRAQETIGRVVDIRKTGHHGRFTFIQATHLFAIALAWLYRYTNGNLTLTPGIGVEWNSDNQNEYYYGRQSSCAGNHRACCGHKKDRPSRSIYVYPGDAFVPLDNSNGINWDLAWLYRYTNGNLTLTPGIGVEWNSAGNHRACCGHKKDRPSRSIYVYPGDAFVRYRCRPASLVMRAITSGSTVWVGVTTCGMTPMISCR